VTIGSPFANVTYVILEVGELDPLPHGEVGELCIGGVHVTRGYRNLPEQTAEKFITHPRFGRLYRTGDKCRIDPRTNQVHFLGRVDAQLKVRGHRVEIQPVEDILQTQFSEIEAAVLDYQNEELIAFVAAPSVARGEFSVVAPAPPEWADGVTARLAQQLPEPSVPSRIFLVEEFVMKPVSGKIDRQCLPDLSRLLPAAEMRDEEGFGDSASGVASHAAAIAGEPVSVVDVEPHSEEVLGICRDVFESPLGWDDAFADHGGHSIIIARLAQRLRAAGWVVPVRALLTDCNTARKVANRPRELAQDPDARMATPSDRGHSFRDEAAAEVLSVRYFTTLQVLFQLLLYSPLFVGFVGLVAFAEIGEFFMSAHLWEFAAVGFLGYLSALFAPFASLLWVMVIKRFMGGDTHKNNLTPGVYPKWSRMHLRTWCIRRMERSVLRPLGMLFRSAPLMAYALRRLGAILHRRRCSDTGGGLHSHLEVGGPGAAHRPHTSGERLEDRTASRRRQRRDGGPRQLDHAADSYPQRRRSRGDLGGSPGSIHWQLYGLETHSEPLQVQVSALAVGDAQHPHAGLPGFLPPCRSDGSSDLVRCHVHSHQRNGARQ
jgi:hypothetical protein